MPINSYEVNIPFRNALIDLTIEVPSGWNETFINNKVCLVLTHGSANDKNFDQLCVVAEGALHNGLMSVRFTYRSPKIIHRTLAYITVMQYISEKYPEVDYYIMGGRSMGSRSALTASNILCQPQLLSVEIQNQDFNITCPDGIASFVNDWDGNSKVIGVVCISYPLHGKNGDVRDLPIINSKCPTLFITGDKDEFCNFGAFKKLLAGQTNKDEEKYKVPASMQSDITEIEFIYDWIPYYLAVFNKSAHGLMIKGYSPKKVIQELSSLIAAWTVSLVRSTIENTSEK